MVSPPENLKMWVNSREYSRIIQTTTYPPFTKGTCMHVPDVEITDFRKRHQIGAFIIRATVSGLGSSTSSGAEANTAVGRPGIYQREGQEVPDNLKIWRNCVNLLGFCVRR